MNKILLLTAALLAMTACSGSKTDGQDSKKESITEKSELKGLRGDWKLLSYNVDSVDTKIDEDKDYILTFDESEAFFGISTDCNSIGGEYSLSSDTIRFRNIAVTQMACPDSKVEQSLVRLLNGHDSYAQCAGDMIILTSPQVGSATFAHIAK